MPSAMEEAVTKILEDMVAAIKHDVSAYDELKLQEAADKILELWRGK